MHSIHRVAGFVLAACIGAAALAEPPILIDVESTDVLTTPSVSEGQPAAGKRVRVTPPEYAGTEVFHTLYLPSQWKRDAAELPIIFEYTGNYYPRAGSTGEPEDAGLGYGLSGGRYIWVSLPYISDDGKDNQVTWWGDEAATLAYAKLNVPRIIREYNADPNAVFLCGFSRGAIGVNYLGLHDDEIAELWTAFVTHDHYDGVREWKGTAWGSPLAKYRQQAGRRLERLAGRPTLVSQNGSTKTSQEFIRSVLDDLENFTFSDVRTAEALGTFPNDFAIHSHNDRWLSKPSPYRTRTWAWMNSVVQQSR